ncbi:MAG TPA: VOC family protein [Candidatus Limnocylindria bacterium]|jgi:uncharacterized glyoxalase superfamily protein PhnB|nr:VOC family protein [Candidatus Limnocylindria bacterium]
MIANRSVPSATVIPVLAYDDVEAASDWICRILTSRGTKGGGTVHVRVPDVRRHHENARKGGAKILQPPTDQPYGERQYSAEDIGGHVWTFSQSIADVDPASWGGTLR